MLIEFSEIYPFFIIVLLVALFTAFVRVLAQKWGFIEWAEVNLPVFFAKLISCNFCSAFWLSTAIGILLFFGFEGEVYNPWLYLLTGVFAAPISRLLA